MKTFLQRFGAWSALELCCLWHVRPANAEMAVMASHKLSTGEFDDRQVEVICEQAEP